MFSLIHGYYLIKTHFADNVDTLFVTKNVYYFTITIEKTFEYWKFSCPI